MPSLPRRRDSALRRLRLDDVPPALVAPVREALSASADALAAMGIEDPRLDSEVMLAEATGWDRAELVANPQADLAPAAARLFGEMVRRRLRREPVAYIVGKKGVRRLDLAAARRGRLPRPRRDLLPPCRPSSTFVRHSATNCNLGGGAYASGGAGGRRGAGGGGDRVAARGRFPGDGDAVRLRRDRARRGWPAVSTIAPPRDPGNR